MEADKLITAVLPQGRGLALLHALYQQGLLRGALGAARAPVTYVRQRGGMTRTRRVWVEKDVLQVVVPADQAAQVFGMIYEAAGVGEAPGSFLFMGALARCSAYALPADLAAHEAASPS